MHADRKKKKNSININVAVVINSDGYTRGTDRNIWRKRKKYKKRGRRQGRERKDRRGEKEMKIEKNVATTAKVFQLCTHKTRSVVWPLRVDSRRFAWGILKSAPISRD